ncbi:unannotated protein [freshwater metagenome]|uniref:Unannotated protein n=1 Tax=freshwater metagenome TaxID=449393 RepID=A0A6J5ZUS6_9ZZZZ
MPHTCLSRVLSSLVGVRWGPRIVLIDGAKLASLMIANGVRVSIAATHVVKTVDFDYFVEDGA